MKKLFRLTKMLLVAAGLCVGVSAWADATTVYERGAGTAWSDADPSTWTGTTGDGYSVTKGDAELVYALNFENLGRYAYEYSHSLTTTDDYKVTMNAVWAAGSPTGMVNASNSYLQLGNVKLRLYGQNSKLTIQIGNSDAVDLMVGSADNNNSTLRSKDFNVTITINKKTKVVDYSVSCSAWNSGTAVTGSGVLTDASVSSVVIGYDRGGQQLKSFSQALKSINITEEEDVTATADYTVKYVAVINEVETEIKDSAVRTGAVGATTSILESDKNSITYNDVKYLYSADDASTKTIADGKSTIVKVTFVEAPTYTYNVTDNLGNTLAGGSAYQGNDAFFYVPYYAFKDNKFYKTPSLSSGTLSYGQSKIPSISANTEITVTYVEEESTNVVFFSEAEKLTGITTFEDGYTQVRMSNGKVGYYATQTAFVNLPAGIYTLTTSTRSGSTTFYAGTVGEGRQVASISSSGAVETITSDPFVLTEASDIYTSVGTESKYFDYVIIRKVGEATIATSLGANGISTFASSYAINADGISGATAYYASSVAGDYVTLTEATGNVAAGTGLILKGTANAAVTIPVAATGDAIDGNKLVGCATATEVTTPNANYYVLVNNGDKAEFQSLSGSYTDNKVTIPAGKAYLNASASPRMLQALPPSAAKQWPTAATTT